MTWHLNFLGNLIVKKRAKLRTCLPSQHRGHWPFSLSPPGTTQTNTRGHTPFPLLLSAQDTTHLNSWNLGIHDNIIISVPGNFINIWFNCNICFLKTKSKTKKTTHDNKWNRTLIKKSERENENCSFSLLIHRPKQQGMCRLKRKD